MNEAYHSAIEGTKLARSGFLAHNKQIQLDRSNRSTRSTVNGWVWLRKALRTGK